MVGLNMLKPFFKINHYIKFGQIVYDVIFLLFYCSHKGNPVWSTYNARV